ncbi:hypothetical protein VDGL01_09028 [Verticillium dahliae]
MTSRAAIPRRFRAWAWRTRVDADCSRQPLTEIRCRRGVHLRLTKSWTIKEELAVADLKPEACGQFARVAAGGKHGLVRRRRIGRYVQHGEGDTPFRTEQRPGAEQSLKLDEEISRLGLIDQTRRSRRRRISNRLWEASRFTQLSRLFSRTIAACQSTSDAVFQVPPKTAPTWTDHHISHSTQQPEYTTTKRTNVFDKSECL